MGLSKKKRSKAESAPIPSWARPVTRSHATQFRKHELWHAATTGKPNNLDESSTGMIFLNGKPTILTSNTYSLLKSSFYTDNSKEPKASEVNSQFESNDLNPPLPLSYWDDKTNSFQEIDGTRAKDRFLDLTNKRNEEIENYGSKSTFSPPVTVENQKCSPEEIEIQPNLLIKNDCPFNRNVEQRRVLEETQQNSFQEVSGTQAKDFFLDYSSKGMEEPENLVSQSNHLIQKYPFEEAQLNQITKNDCPINANVDQRQILERVEDTQPKKLVSDLTYKNGFPIYKNLKQWQVPERMLHCQTAINKLPDSCAAGKIKMDARQQSTRFHHNKRNGNMRDEHRRFSAVLLDNFFTNVLLIVSPIFDLFESIPFHVYNSIRRFS
ncbi:uncharacterized protein [Parasteatoda tepidariorum]|uniref:uncharacterized protein n=1 Tax=Parasteatoda tepidariorum TaxID=114398 RepID=UPI001C71BB84|nr:uncharacterized protein LOC107441177 [Parasteatoda tepidariorum]